MSVGLPEVCVVYLLRDREGHTEVLLGEKRLGLGQGKVVAPGGKLEPGEDAAAAAVREVNEEVGILLGRESLELVGDLSYLFPTRPEWSQRSWAFVARGAWGDPIPSEELHAGWAPLEQIPFDRMWDDASHWLPDALAGVFIQATFEFGADLSSVVATDLTPSLGAERSEPRIE